MSSEATGGAALGDGDGEEKLEVKIAVEMEEDDKWNNLASFGHG